MIRVSALSVLKDTRLLKVYALKVNLPIHLAVLLVQDSVASVVRDIFFIMEVAIVDRLMLTKLSA